MNIYLIECNIPCGDHGTFLIKANNKQEAIDIVWKEHYIHENKKAKENGYDPYYKSDLLIRDVEKEILNNSYIERI